MEKLTGFNNSKAHKIDEFKNMTVTKLRDTPILPKYKIFDVKNKREKKIKF